MLAFLDASACRELLSTVDRQAVTAHTIIDLELLLAELAATRERGYAVDNQENEIGARCVGVPILNAAGSPFAAISISGPVGRVGDDLLPMMAARLWRASHEISRRLGHRLPPSAPQSTVVAAGGDGQ
jgi:IclR family acetate operon transcriptional repressor